MTHLIPETPNRQATSLISVVPFCNPTDVAQVAVPSIARIDLCRTPPVTVAANVVVNAIVDAVTARKRRK